MLLTGGFRREGVLEGGLEVGVAAIATVRVFGVVVAAHPLPVHGADWYLEHEQLWHAHCAATPLVAAATRRRLIVARSIVLEKL